VLFAIALLTVFITAFYMFRAVFTTFGGSYRGRSKPHESSAAMLLPMLVMAVLAVCAGWLNATGAIDSLLGDGTKHAWTTGIFGVFTHSLTWISLLMAAAGIFLAWAIYVKRWFSAERISSRFALPYFFFINKYCLTKFIILSLATNY
jgi:NADH-quinone oxidoreductase subunit L